jgi:D-alanyl-lipoteichoic acid acyltransferase DltB (MBOAT superfamily)
MIFYSNRKDNTFSKKHLLLIGLFFNIGLLLYFKYMDFFITNINYLTDSNLSLLHLALPLGISFFTLQQIAFLIDSYEGLVKEKNFLDYTLFVTFFPQLIAGPIVHHKDVMPQFSMIRNKVINYKNITAGLFIFSIGLFKKVIIADTFATFVKDGFDISTELNFVEGWVSSLSYTFQLYFDFSAYSDMAIGVALLFNIKLPQNFNSPLKATGMIDYWKRWHITLTNFITSYIYTPIIRSFKRVTFNKAMVATIIIFLISGMWHGAGWTFIFWGFLHGLSIVINHYWKKKVRIKLHWFLAGFITFNFVNFGNIFFRAKDFDDALKVLSSMVDIHTIILPAQLENTLHFLSAYGYQFGEWNHIGGFQSILWLIVGFILTFGFNNSMQQLKDFRLNYKTMLLAGFAFIISILSMDKVSEFIYFNF